MLYIRMALSMVVGLYTGRVVLNTLGAEDYGINGVVGGIVGMMTFINTSMSGATSRFLIFELGKGDKKKLANTFSMAFATHLIIALLLLIIAETFGIWFLNTKLVIPENRMFAAHWVYQISILSMLTIITQVPYNAMLIAHEKFDIFAYFELLSVTLKLLIVFLLVIGDFDKLILYSTLGLCVTVLIAMLYRFYCKRHFEETTLHFVYDKSIMKNMLSFSLWDLYGNCSVSMERQGRNFLINMFFGLTYNAAASVALTVAGVVQGFSGTIMQVFKPHIIKLYAAGKLQEMEVACGNAMKYSLILFSYLAVPVIIEADCLFSMWLVDVPPYAPDFCRFILIVTMLNINNSILCQIIHATGRIKRISLITGTIFFLHLPVYYLAFKLGADVISCYVLEVVGLCFVILSNLLIAKRNIPTLRTHYIFKNFLQAFFTILPVAVLAYFFSMQLDMSFYRMVSVSIFYAVLLSVVVYTMLLDNETRVKVQKYVMRFVHL